MEIVIWSYLLKFESEQVIRVKQVIRVQKLMRAAAPCTRITWVSLLGSEEPLLKLLRSGKLQGTNSSPISNCRRSKSAIFILRNINYNINSLLLLHVGTHIIYIYIYRALHTGSQNENNIGAAAPPALELLARLFRFRRAFAESYYIRRSFSTRILAQFQIVGIRNQPSLFRVI